MRSKKVLFVFIDWFDPAYKAGGPIRSVTNFVQSLQTYFSIYVFTSDRDLGDSTPLAGIDTDIWMDYDKEAHVFYASPSKLNCKSILHEIRTLQPDFIYCNSLFSTWFTICPLLMKRLGLVNAQFVLAPKGMLRPSALRFKPVKKRIFLALFRLLRFPGIIRFHATDAGEEECIRKALGHVTVFPILDSPAALPPAVMGIAKEQGAVKLLFVGRIHPIKQLDFLLCVLKKMEKDVHLTIVGVVEDTSYWEKCKELINILPASVKVNFVGEIIHHQLAQVIDQHHIFVLPTLGENFGHAIYEALGAGRPVLISDQTPWRNLSACKAGWDLSLKEPEQFSAALEEAIGWDQATYDRWMNGARQYVESYVKKNELTAAYRQLFNFTLPDSSALNN